MFDNTPTRPNTLPDIEPTTPSTLTAPMTALLFIFFKYMSCKETNIFYIYIHCSYVPKMYKIQTYNICLIAIPVNTLVVFFLCISTPTKSLKNIKDPQESLSMDNLAFILCPSI